MALEGNIDSSEKGDGGWKMAREAEGSSRTLKDAQGDDDMGLLGGADVVLPRTVGHMDVVQIDYTGTDIRLSRLHPRAS